MARHVPNWDICCYILHFVSDPRTMKSSSNFIEGVRRRRKGLIWATRRSFSEWLCHMNLLWFTCISLLWSFTSIIISLSISPAPTFCARRDFNSLPISNIHRVLMNSPAFTHTKLHVSHAKSKVASLFKLVQCIFRCFFAAHRKCET